MMNKLLHGCLGLICSWLSVGSVLAETCEGMNAPDSVYIFSYSYPDGTSGLKFAWSPDGEEWHSVGNGYEYVKSDFGPWGAGKKMFRPQLIQGVADGKWHCLWQATQSGKVVAHAASADLLSWGRQSYFVPEERTRHLPQDAVPADEVQVCVDNQMLQGYRQRVAYPLVEQLMRYADHKRYRQQLYDERMEQDAVRFAGLTPVKASITVNHQKAKPISDKLIGIFFEDINYAADGGLYAELVQNRDFEYTAQEWGGERFSPQYAWSLVDGGEADAHVQPLQIADEQPLHPNNPHYAVVPVAKPGIALQNSGYDGITLKKGEKYDCSFFARVTEKHRGGQWSVRLLDEQGTEVAASVVSVSSTQWKKVKTVLKVSADVRAAVLSLEPQKAGVYHLDMISLFPQHTFHGRKNGLRADLAQALADLKPRFVRFPGGCVAHGNGIDNMYDWKGSIGPLETRKPLRNLWGYHQTRGLGYFEYFQFCEDIGAEPLPVLSAGVPCQNSSNCSHHATGELGCWGQQGGIPMEDMAAYVQDVLDLIEYANGDAKQTVWGRKRAEAGHPKPFGLKYIGIGNEDLITDVFEERFTMIYKAVREKYPHITVVGTVGPFYEGTDYDEGWKLADKLSVPMVDEHYYVSPGWMIHNQDYYDRYDRKKSKVYLGEYAAHLPGRPNNLETALSEALYLTAVERNGDVVAMASYAPLLAKDRHTQWNPDLIYFNNQEVKPTVGYYVQQMYGQNAGNLYLDSEVVLDNSREEVRKRIGVSVVKDTASDTYVVKLVNLLPVEVKTALHLEEVNLESYRAVKSILTGRPTDKKLLPQQADFELTDSEWTYSMPAYSFTVIRIYPSEKK